MLECKCILFLFLCFLQSFLLIVPVRFMFCQSHQLICYPEKGCNKFFWIWSNSFPINIMFIRIQLYVKSYHLYVSFVFVEFLLTIATSGTVPEIDENSFVMNSVSFIQHHCLVTVVAQKSCMQVSLSLCFFQYTCVFLYRSLQYSYNMSAR